MRVHAFFAALLLFVSLTLTGLAQSSPWRSSLYPENWQAPPASVSFTSDAFIQDFSYAGYKRGEQPLPTVTGPIFNVVTGYGADPTGAADSTLAIQAAINAAAAAGGGVVYLPPGEFHVSPQGTGNSVLRISTSNIVLRGAGTAQTYVLNTSASMREKSIIQIAPTSAPTGPAQAITADLLGPTRRIPVANPGAFAPGNIVRIEWSFTPEWIAEHGQQTWWNETNAPANARYLREVLAINTTEGWIEVDVPTRYSIKTRDNPTVRRADGLLTNVGIESFAIGNVQSSGTTWGEADYEDPTKPAYLSHSSWCIRISNTRDSWVSAIHSRQPVGNTSGAHLLSNGISLSYCSRVTVQNCEMRRAQYGGGGGNGYMYRLQQSNECLIKNNVADFSRHGFVVSHAGASGNVFLQCEDRNTSRATGHTGSYGTGGSGSDNHMHFSHSNLWDSCLAHDSYFTAHHRGGAGTASHALTSAHAVYWNTSGSGTRYATATQPIVRSEQARYGYVIGTRALSGSTAYHASNETEGNTAPADILQGIGTGATLAPQSLYLDQLARRRPAVLYLANGATGGSVPVDPASPYLPGNYVTILAPGNLAKTGSVFIGWNTAPGGTGVAYAPGASFPISITTSLYAQWNARPSIAATSPAPVALDPGAGWSPAQLTTVAWFDADDATTLTRPNNIVSDWADKSGNNNHASQPTAALRPTVGTAVLGGLRTVSFRIGDGTNKQFLSAAHHASLNLDASGGANLFAVFRHLGFTNNGSTSANAPLAKGHMLAADSAYGIRLGSDQALGFKAGTDSLPSASSPDSANQALLYSGTRNDSTRTAAVYLQGSLATSATKATAILSDNTHPLLLGRDPASARYTNIDFGEILVLGGTLSSAERQRIEGYLAHKWSLAAALPANHLYKDYAPGDFSASVQLSASVTDAEGNPLTHVWSVVSGPGPVIFGNASAPTTSVTFAVAGTYTLRLTSSDAYSSTSRDLVVQVAEDNRPTVSFTAQGGSPSSPTAIEVTLDSSYGTLPTVTRSGYSFVGWFTAPSGGSLVTSSTTVTNVLDHTLYAQWNARPTVSAGTAQSVTLDELVPWSPEEITTAAWFDADDTTTLIRPNNIVSDWADKSGNNNHASQPTAALRPTVGTAVLGGLRTVSFRIGDGTNKQFLTAAHSASLNLDASGGVNLFAVFRHLGFVNNGSTSVNAPLAKGNMLTADSAYGIRLGSDQALGFKAGTDSLPSASSPDSANQALLYSGTRNDSTRTASVYLQGTLATSATKATAILSDNTHPLHLGRDPASARYTNIDFGEILVLSGIVSTAERQRIEGYLAHKWSLDAALPASHPHKAYPPGEYIAIASLSGSASDANSDSLTHAWSVVSGPAPVTFANASALATTATFTAAGSYTLRLTSSDGLGSSSATLAITVNPTP